MERFCDNNGREYALIAETKEGDILQVDGNFTCIKGGEIITVKKDCEGRLYFKCDHGFHGLDGQEAEKEGHADFYVGLYPVVN